jgi:hypothetical protein
VFYGAILCGVLHWQSSFGAVRITFGSFVWRFVEADFGQLCDVFFFPLSIVLVSGVLVVSGIITLHCLFKSPIGDVCSHGNCGSGMCSREKIRPEQELQRAEAQILHSKLAIREAMHELDDLGLEGSLDENAFDSEGRVYHEEVFSNSCKECRHSSQLCAFLRTFA